MVAKKNKVIFSLKELAGQAVNPQPIAAENLGVSLSTLKRRWYELKLGRWKNEGNFWYHKMRIHNLVTTNMNPTDVDFSFMKVIFAHNMRGVRIGDMNRLPLKKRKK